MDNKKTFYGLSIINIIISIYAIINRENILKEQIENLKNIMESTNDNLKEYIQATINNTTANSLIITASISILISLIIMLIVYKNDLTKIKNSLITGVIFGFLFSINKYSEAVYAVMLVAILCIKSENKKEVKKKELPKLEKHDTSLKDILLGIGFIALYFSQLILDKYITTIYSLMAFETLLIICALLLYKNDLKRDLIALKNNFGTYIGYCIRKWGLMLLTMIGINIITTLIFGDIAEPVNQKLVEKLPMFYLIPSAIIMAPIVEETLFRVTYRKIFRNDIVFIIMSGLCFGLLHVMSEPTLIDMLRFSLTYITMGSFMAHTYTKTNNMTSSMIIHMLQNALGCIAILFI